jgi:hypothetical protein
MRYWFSELLQKKQRSPHSRVLKVRHWAAEGKIHSEYTMMLHRPHPLQGQHPVIYHPVSCRTLSQMETIQKSQIDPREAVRRQIQEARQIGLIRR